MSEENTSPIIDVDQDKQTFSKEEVDKLLASVHATREERKAANERAKSSEQKVSELEQQLANLQQQFQGVNPEEYRKLQEQVENARKYQEEINMATANIQSEWQSKLDSQSQEHQRQLTALIQQADRQLMDGALKDAFIQAGGNPHASKAAIESFRSRFNLTKDETDGFMRGFEITVKDEKGATVFDPDRKNDAGDPLPMEAEKFFKTMKGDERYSYLFLAPQLGGAGLGPGNSFKGGGSSIPFPEGKTPKEIAANIAASKGA